MARTRSYADPCRLTPLQQRVWQAKLDGLSRQEIAERFGLSVKSVGQLLLVAKDKASSAHETLI